MKLRVTTGHLLNHTNRHRLTTSHALHSRHLPSLQLSRPHVPKCPIRLTNPQPPCKWSLIILYLHLLSHRPRILLRLIPQQRNLKHWSYPAPGPNSNCLRRLRTPLRTNIILRGYSNHQPILSNPLHRPITSRVGLRGIFSRQSHTNTILRPPLPPPIRHRRTHTGPSHLPT